MTAINPKAENPVPVIPISEMDKEAFTAHMSLRHNDSLGGLAELPSTISEYDENLYRSFHKRLHETRVDLAHDHSPGDSPWQDGYN